MTKRTQTERNQAWRDKNKAWFYEYRSQLACQECGESHPAIISFHHRDPKQKSYAVAEMPNRGCSRKAILRELEKCDVLCHNCHAKLHFEATTRPFMLRQQQQQQDTPH